MREIEQRRAAALTPGKDRRRSGRQQRETPRDVLRQLSKVLAPGTKPVEVTPVNQQANDARGPLTRLNDVDEEPMPPRPRLSMALGDEEDDTLLLPPHSDALLDDDNMTMRSVELPRRAVSEQPGGRLSRGSFDSIRTSDRFDQTMQELGMDVFGSERFDPSFVQGGFDDDDGESMLHDEPSILSERTATVDLRNAFLGEELRRVSTASGRPSDVHRLLPDDENDTTFAFQVPQRDGQAASAQAKNAHTARSGLGVVREDEEDEEGEEEEEVDEMEEPEEAKEHKELEEEMEAELEEGDEGSDPDQIDHTDVTMNETTIMHEAQASAKNKAQLKRTKKTIRVSRHGIQYSSLPAGVVKKLATTFLKTGGSNAKIRKDTLATIMQASDWFFEQVSDDLGAYAEHAGRKTIDENDVITLMKR
jgi:histone H3/H4